MSRARDDIRAELQANRWVSTTEVGAKLGLHPDTVYKQLAKMEKDGLVRRTREQGRVRWSLVSTDAGDVVSGKPQSAQDAIWRVMRVRQQFSVTDLHFALATSYRLTPEREIQKFCSALLDAGYLRVLTRADPGRGVVAQFRLIRNTGPLPPAVERREVVRDRNEDRVLFVKGASL